MTVTESRSEKVERVNNAKNGAKLIGFNDRGQACIWYGGYSFSVYDLVDWQEVETFTSGQLAGVPTSESDELKKDIARQHMESRAFEPVE